jgi:Xaa-Pro aminopeptidase
MRKRLQKLYEKAREAGVDGFLVTNLPNIRYLCGYSGSNGMLLVTRHGSYFYTDFRYQEQVRREVKGARAVIRDRDLVTSFPVEHTKGIRRLGFEQAFVSFGSYKALQKQLQHTRLVPCANFTSGLRAVKDGSELKLIARAASIADKVLKQVLALVKPGVTEKDLAAEIDYRFLQHDGIAFDTIVASGPNGALPHAQPSNRKLKRGDAIVFDIGAKFQGYCSDMTRTVFLGRADRKAREVYEIVLDAQLRALGGVKAGAECAAVDALARNHIREKGFGREFGHGLGHGVGLEVHEAPGLSARAPDTLLENQVVTVEPGIYLPGWGGVRIEDLVAVTPRGCRILSATSKRLTAL